MGLRTLVLLSVLASTVSSQERDEEKKEHTRVVFHLTETRPGGSAEKALVEYNKWVADGSDPAKLPALMEALYKAAGGGEVAFKRVAHLIAKGLKPGEVNDKSLKHLQISEAHSQAMARLRETYIEQVIEDVLKSKKGEWKVCRSDSGNPMSGMKSDLDQTFYVMKKGPYGDWVRVLDGDREFIELFREKWKERFPGISLEALDIASIEGKQRFPDPRDVHLNFEAKFAETIRTLRNTPGAYTYPGAVVSQMQLRALLALLQGEERAFMEYELDENGRLKKLPFNREFGQRVLFGITPALMPGHAFGAAFANYLTLRKSVRSGKFDPKYHLRVWDDCGQLLAIVEGRIRGGFHEYIDLPADERASRNKRIIDVLFKDPRQRAMHRLSMEASRKLRLIHKGGEKNIRKAFDGDLPDPKARQARIYDELARALNDIGPDDPPPTKRQIQGAIAEHHRLALEFDLANVRRSAAKAFKTYKDIQFKRPLDIDAYRHLVRLKKEADWPKVKKNIEYMLRTQLLFQLYDAGIWHSIGILRDLRKDLGADYLGLKEMAKLWAKGRVAPISDAELRGALLRDMYRQLSVRIDLDKLTLKGAARNMDALAERVQRAAFHQLGFKYVDEAYKVGPLLRLKRLGWSFKKFAKHNLIDAGALDGLLQILRALVLSDEDLDHFWAVVTNEAIFAVPIAGQVYAATKGGWEGVVLIGGALALPPVGVFLVTCSIGEAGYTIYDQGYVRHVRNNVVDALYYGFSGEPTRVFENAPPPFTFDDDIELMLLKRDMSKAREGNDTGRMAGLATRIAPLQRKLTIWKAFRDGSWAGSFYHEWGKLDAGQKPILVSIYMDVPPIVSYSPKDVLDFRADFGPRDYARMRDLEQRIEELHKDANNYKEYLTALSEWHEMEYQRNRFEHARRFLNAAVGRGREGLSELEKRQGIPELLHKMRRDSLYPALKERAIRLNRGEKGSGETMKTTNPDQFVDDWIESVGDWAVRELADKGVMTGWDKEDLKAKGFLWKPSMVDRLKDRVTQDFLRSKHLWEVFRKQEKNRLEVEKIRLRKRIEAYRLAKAGLVVDQFDLTDVTTAMMLMAVKRNAPVVDADVIVSRKLGDEEGRLDEEAEVTVRLRVTADRQIYPGPYTWTLHRLNREAAANAIGTGKLDGGIPLTDKSKARLQKLLGDAGLDDVMIPVVSVFSKKIADLSKALKATVEHLPTQKTSNGIFMGQTVPATAPETIEPDDEPYFVTHDAQPTEDRLAPTRWLKKHYPELAAIDWKPRFRPIQSFPTELAPVLGRISRKHIAARMAKNRNRGRPVHDGLLTGVANINDPVALRLRCNGETRYIYFNEGRKGHGARLGSAQFSGLPDGTHEVEAVFVLKDGQRARQTFRVVVKQKHRGSLEQLAQSVARARDAVAKGGNKRMLWIALYYQASRARANLGAGVAETESRLAKLLELAGEIDVRSEALAFTTECLAIGTPRAYELAKRFRARDASHEYYLAMLAAANNDLTSARRHWAKHAAWLKAQNPDRPADDMSWWPTKVSFGR